MRQHRQIKYKYHLKTPSQLLYDDLFKDWKQAVFKRDKRKCQMPGCIHGKRVTLQAHHIFSRQYYPALQFDIDNGITLCTKCHQKIRQTEDLYVAMFAAIVQKNKSIEAEKLKRKKSK